MGNRLLILSCSMLKKSTKGKIPAIERYDGPYYRSLRKLMKNGDMFHNIDVKIISAKYGLLDQLEEIENYDCRMNSKRAYELNGDTIRALERLFKSKSYSDMLVVLGKDYLPSINGFEKFTDAKIIYAEGGIGYKRQQMIEWIKCST